MTLGNMGTSDYTCANINVARNEKTFQLHCPYGTMRTFTEFGLQKVDNQSCSDALGYYVGENGAWDDLQFDCTFETGLSADGRAGLEAAFEADCYDRSTCELRFQYYWLNRDCRNRVEYYAAGSQFPDYAEAMGWHYHLRDSRRREPVVFANVLCIADKVYHPFVPGKELGMGKAEFVYVILFLDFLTLMVSIWFINLLFYRYKEYATAFDSTNVEMRDFVLRFGNLPNDYIYGGKDLMLQC